MRRLLILTSCVIVGIVVLAFFPWHPPAGTRVSGSSLRDARVALLEELRPVALKNCTIKRVGSPNDGGYLMCDNLMPGVESAYSYGIDKEDNWGCQVSLAFDVPVHQYDCFTPYRPTCAGGRAVYHNECIGPKREIIESRPFDTLANQIARNGDSGKRLLVKIDIEGAEWESLLATPDDVLARIDQLPMELHLVNAPKFLELVRKLKRNFYPVSLHFNNQACAQNLDPIPAWAFQVLFVNKRVAELDPSQPGRVPGSSPDAPDSPTLPDCQSPIK
ncbi:MAG: hypothetical protein ND807_04825 [Vicinamibacterales bacterium]|nr:hypothetical protein [Vicinamibacterales bacterium]